MSNKLHTIHDILFKRSLENPEIARDFFKAHLPQSIQKCIDFSSLAVKKGSFIDNDYTQYHTDMLFSADINNKQSFIYLLVEHQSTP